MFENLDGFFGKSKSRHQVGNERHAPGKNLAANFFAALLIDEAEHCGRVGMIDEFVRQKSVQHHLNRRVRSARIDQIGAFDGQQFLVPDGRERAQPAHRLEPDRRKAGGRDTCHVDAGSFNAQDFDFRAKGVAHLGLQRRVAAAVQHKFGITAQETRAVNAKR